MDRTAAGGLQVESLGAGIRRRTLAFINLSVADVQGLVLWFDTIANGAANAFTLIDEDSQSLLVRWMNGFNFSEDKAGYSGSIELEIVE